MLQSGVGLAVVGIAVCGRCGNLVNKEKINTGFAGFKRGACLGKVTSVI